MDWKTLLNKERPRHSTNSGDHRAEFERDLDRTIFSTPVKRLQDKAQVFPLDPNDAVRTRLTHSLEVSSVARGLGIAVSQWLLAEQKIELGMDRSIEAIAATCGLIHDLGNPPFGHSGEFAIRYWFEKRFGEEQLARSFDNKRQLIQDCLNFEGNAQSLRLLTKLQILADFHGLNLTYGTLSAACKYPVSSDKVVSDEIDHSRSKPGYFASENDIITLIRNKTGTGESRNPIAFLVEAADDIVYSVADMEDAIKKGVMTWSVTRGLLEEQKDPATILALEKMERILKAGNSSIPKDLPDDVYASAFRTASIGVVVQSVIREFKANYHAIMEGKYKDELVSKCDTARLTEKLKKIGRERVYNTPSNLKLELMGRRVICDLMDIFWEGAEVLPIDEPLKTKKFPGKAGALLSSNYRRVFYHSVKEQTELPEIYHRFQLVTDYVCGMTDTFAKRLHAELMNG